MSVFEEFWEGKLDPQRFPITEEADYRAASERAFEEYEEARAHLTKEQKQMVERCMESMTECSSIYEKYLFLYGLRIGMRLVIEAVGRT